MKPEPTEAEATPPPSTPPAPAPVPCLNCGAPLEGRFCAVCGQERGDRRLSFATLLKDALGDLFAYDGRLFSSLHRLLLHPGELTRAYLAGKRASQIPPFRLYLVLSVVLFFVFSLERPDAAENTVYVGGELIGEVAEGPGTSTIRILEPTSSRTGRWLRDWLDDDVERLKTIGAQALLDAMHAQKRTTMPQALIFFIPLLALALRVLYLRSGWLYYDHLVFALHFQSFLFLILAVGSLIGGFLPMLAGGLLIAPIYLFLALRRVYGGTIAATGVRFVLLGLAYLVLFSVVASAIVVWVIKTI